MPLPVAHSLTGFAIYQLKPLRFFKKVWQDVFFLLCVANLADLDFLPGFLIGDPNRFHHTYTHTPFVALCIALIGAYYFKKKNNGNYTTYFMLLFSVYFSHIFLDYFTEDLKTPIGVMLCWPFNSNYYISPVTIFDRVIRSNNSFEFFPSLFNMHNLKAIIKEFMITGTLVAIARVVRRK